MPSASLPRMRTATLQSGSSTTAAWVSTGSHVRAPSMLALAAADLAPCACTGIGRIYLYDHNSSAPMNDAIQEHIDSGFVKYINFQGARGRGELQQHT